jgi:predicted nucleotidyltransferase
MTTPVREESIRKIVEVIVESASPDQVFLFGSRAQGTSTGESDFDFLVVVPDVKNERDISRQVYRALLNNHVNQAVDIVVVSRNKLEHHKNNPYFVYAQALKEGIKFYDRATAF